jgi:outer membrane autotransporter protein
LLTAPDADAYLASLSPEAYLAAGDYALTIARSVTDSAFGQASLLKNGYWTLGAGYNRAQHGYRGPDAANDYELSGDTSVVTLTRDFGPHCSVGFFYGYNTGKTAASNARLDYRGNVFGLTSLGRFEGKHPITLKAAVVATDLRFDAVRNGSTANDQKLRSLSGQLTASIELYKDARLSFSPLIGYVQGRSTSDAFSETGSGARLNVSAMHRDTARALAGVGASYILSNDLTLDASFAYEHEFATDPATVTARFADSFVEVPMTLERTVGDRSTTSASLGASWKIDNAITLRLGAEVRGNRELTKDYRYNVGLNYRF